MCGLWDIHNHILPGVDDGSSCMEESMILIKQEYEQGVRNIIFTPHYRAGMFTVNTDERYEMFEELCKVVESHYSDVNLMLGCEMFIDGINDIDVSDRYSRMAGLDIVLVEFSYRVSYAAMIQLLDRLKRQNMRVIIAHAERYKCLREDVGRVSELRSLGYYIQVNCDAVIGRDGIFVKRFVLKLLKNKLVDFVSSDSHNIDKRSVRVGNAYKYISKRYGKELSEMLFAGNAQRLFGKEAE